MRKFVAFFGLNLLLIAKVIDVSDADTFDDFFAPHSYGQLTYGATHVDTTNTFDSPIYRGASINAGDTEDPGDTGKTGNNGNKGNKKDKRRRGGGAKGPRGPYRRIYRKFSTRPPLTTPFPKTTTWPPFIYTTEKKNSMENSLFYL